MRIACAAASCSACENRSSASQSTGAVPSEMIRISLGPAITSIPTGPNTRRFAAATYAPPGPTILSTRGIVAVPNASAAIACAPPTENTRSTPAMCSAASTERIAHRVGRRHRHDDFADAGDTRRHHSHQHRRWVCSLPTGHVNTDSIERRHAVADSIAECVGDFESALQLCLVELYECAARPVPTHRVRVRVTQRRNAASSRGTDFEVGGALHRSADRNVVVYSSSAASPRSRTAAMMSRAALVTASLFRYVPMGQARSSAAAKSASVLDSRRMPSSAIVCRTVSARRCLQTRQAGLRSRRIASSTTHD